MFNKTFTIPVVTLALIGLVLSTGCIRKKPKKKKSSRPGLNTQGINPGGNQHQHHDHSNSPVVQFPKFYLTAPNNWVREKPSNEFRLAQFFIQGHSDIKVTLFHFGNPTENLVQENFTRWKKNFSKITEAKTKELPPGNLHYGKWSGTIKLTSTPMSKEFVEKENYTFLGGILLTPEGPLYVKLIGPKQVLDHEEQNFIKFLQSYTRGMAPDSAHHPEGRPAQANRGQNPHQGQNSHGKMPPGHPPTGGHGKTNRPRTTGQPTALALPGITLTTPAAWVPEKPSSRMRKFQFAVANSTSLKVTGFYFGEAGGDKVNQANINRWVDQFTQVDNKQIYPLPTPGMVLLTVTGTFKKKPFPMAKKFSAVPNYMTIAAIVPTDKGPYFFKLVGPKSQVAPELNHFLQFLYSHKKGKVSQKPVEKKTTKKKEKTQEEKPKTDNDPAKKEEPKKESKKEEQPKEKPSKKEKKEGDKVSFRSHQRDLDLMAEVDGLLIGDEKKTVTFGGETYTVPTGWKTVKPKSSSKLSTKLKNSTPGKISPSTNSRVPRNSKNT